MTDMQKHFGVHILKEYFEINFQYFVSENKLIQFKAWAAFALSLLECQPCTSDCVWLTLAGSGQIRIMTSNHYCLAFADDTITGSYMPSEISIRLLKYFFYNQHIGCFKGQVRGQGFLHNYKCGNAYSKSQALLLGKLPVIVPQSKPAVIVHSSLICNHTNVVIKYWSINYNLEMNSV